MELKTCKSSSFSSIVTENVCISIGIKAPNMTFGDYHFIYKKELTPKILSCIMGLNKKKVIWFCTGKSR